MDIIDDITEKVSRISSIAGMKALRDRQLRLCQEYPHPALMASYTNQIDVKHN